MANGEMNSSWCSGKRKPKSPTLSEMINNRREACSPYIAGELRVALVQRKMTRHGFTEEQALAEILAFS